ncbi:hypothetical protein TCAL_10445 [Tigriopus californicus]|uniref:protein kinase C n=1 Tax=Tigriopus californicus TaxID=6832 RepID=A0A553PU52_TIGCA|nr:cyclin-G-associated kinase-like [Tigriopus californicus]TRY81208.1 hypothetical protein TCAL_10445 [Tigriopus californicus]|eukprot:TCALIF_10445-PA protein Name:"Similar to Gak Cyclin-G-associated kinase (Rattus norvegicus)" AED:0.00 eAED:0.00 QI:231/1/1/1/1/1/2/153/1135
MFKTALNYLSSNVGVYGLDEGVSEGGIPDPIIGSMVDVGGQKVKVQRRIGEGGFAFVYAVQSVSSPPRPFALKRLLAADADKRAAIVQEITLLKSLKNRPNILQYETAAHLPQGQGLSASKCEEYLLLTELCAASLYDYLSPRSMPYPPVTAGRVFFQTLEAVSYLHRASPAIAHRDLKVENLLIDGCGRLKLCDFGSATTHTYLPDETWNMGQRTRMEEEIQKFTTPMYRSPEMVDVWCNHPVGIASDVWALGCLLYQLCFHVHPFPEGTKLQIINANFYIPDTDVTHTMFHDLIRQMLVVDPTCRPSVQQAQEHLGEVAVYNGWDLEDKIDFEIQLNLPSTPEHGPANGVPKLDLSPTHQPGTVPAPTATQLLTSLKGGAGSMFGRIKDTSKSVMSSLLSPKDIDFHLLTSRLAAMSLPVDGIDYNYKNQIEDIRQIMENHHSAHYAIVNVCERKYPASRFVCGTVIDSTWSSQIIPSIEQVLEMSIKVIEFLSKDKKNVVVIHCLNGKSNSAMLFSAVMLVGKVFSHYSEALALFEEKRCEPQISFGQRSVLIHLEKLLQSGPSLTLSQQVLNVNSIILEPVPLFTKALDGTRPFYEIYQGSQLISTNFQDYGSLKLYTAYDGEIVMKLNVKLMGDITVIVFHGRQSMGTFFAGKLEKILIGKIFFNTSQLPANKSYVKFKTHELDALGDIERIPDDFSIAVNYTIREQPKETIYPYKMPTHRKLDLFFSTKGEYNEAMTFGKKVPTPTAPLSDASQVQEQSPTRPPRQKKASPPLFDVGDSDAGVPKPSSLIDIAGLEPQAGGKKTLNSTGHLNLTPPEAKSDPQAGFFDLTPPKPQSAQPAGFFDLTPPDQGKDTLLNFGGSAPRSATEKSSPDDILLDFDGFPSVAPPPTNASKPSSTNFDLFDNVPSSNGNSADLLQPSGAPNLADLLAPQPQEPAKSASEQMVDDMLSQMNLNSRKSAGGDNKTPQPTSQGPSGKPNYNSAFFNAQTNNGNGQARKPPTRANFDDLLGGFAPSGDSQNQTIGEMQKKKQIKAMTPEEAHIFEWTHGRSRNLRALLCSLDTVVWSGSRWTKCGMHQLVTFDNVKKMYRRACLAVHPDKQMGTENEDLAKKIFTELNDAWSKFQEDESP